MLRIGLATPEANGMDGRPTHSHPPGRPPAMKGSEDGSSAQHSSPRHGPTGVPTGVPTGGDMRFSGV